MDKDFKKALYEAANKDCKILGKAFVNKSMNGVISMAHELFEKVNDGIVLRGLGSNIGKCMDLILVDHGVNALVSTNGQEIYMEYLNPDGKRDKCVFDGKIVLWAGSAPTNEVYYLPYLLYAVAYDMTPIKITGPKGTVDYTEKELKDFFVQIVSDYLGTGTTNKTIMIKLCDAFYYGYANVFANCAVNENDDKVIQKVKHGYISGFYKEMEEIAGVSRPIFDTLKDIKIESTDKKPSIPLNQEVTFDDCLNGKCVINHEWSPVVEGYIPDIEMLNNYFPVPQYMRILKKIRYRMNRIMARMDTPGIKNVIGKDYLNITLTGKPGTGKTVLIYNLAAALGMPVCSVNLSKNTDEDTFQGMNKVINGQMGFVETEFLQIYQNGGIIILEEVNLCDPAVTMGALGQAIEYPFVLKKDGYETVHRHPMCIIFSTKNINTFGSRGVNQAFSNRFPNSYILDDPTDDDFMNILEKNAFDNASCKKVLNAYKRITAYLTSTQVNDEEAILSLSLRTCIAALQTMEEGVSYKDALRDTFIGKIAETDGELARDVERCVVSVLPG